MDIRKKRRDQIEGVPPLDDSWPVHFNLPSENRDELLGAIEACVERRIYSFEMRVFATVALVYR